MSSPRPGDAGPKLTPAQSDSIERTDLSLAVTSGAGCGKTFVLTRRYLRTLEQIGEPGAINHVVAVTYTEKAAGEMRQRVGELLGERIAAAVDPARRTLLSEWLSRLGSARIGTIHGFCASLLRSFAFEAGIDPGFAVQADEFQRRQMQREACERAVRKHLETANANTDTLLDRFGYERIVGLVRALVVERWRWRADGHADPDATLARWRHELAEMAQQAWARLDLPAIDDEMNWLAGAPCDNPADKLAVHLTGQLATLALLIGRPESRTPQTFGELKARPGGIGSAKAWGSKEDVLQVRHRCNDLVKRFESLGAYFRDFNDADRTAACCLAALTGMADRAVKLHAAAKRRAGVLDFDDLLIGARDLPRDNADVRRRVAGDISHLLIDEFQDTDSLQRELLWLAAGAEVDALPPGRVFFVGDAKQSIYRFRGADVEVFEAARDAVGPDNRRALDLNFRTLAPGIDLVNRLFEPLMGSAYEPLTAFRTDRPERACAQILLAEPDGDRAPALVRASAGVMANRIAEMLANAEPIVWDKLTKRWRAVRAGDIAILFPRLQYTAPWEEALTDAGVNYYIVGGAGLYRQQEVYDLVNALRAIDNPLDDVALMGFLRGGMIGLDDNVLLHVAMICRPPYRRKLREPALADRLSPADHARLIEAADILDDLSARKDALDLDEVIERLLERTGFEAALLGEHHGPRKCGNVRRVIEHARQAGRAGATLREFTDYVLTLTVEQTKIEQAAADVEGGDVVRIMTVHKAKGLEFPVVFLPDLNWPPKHRSSTLLVRGPMGLTLKIDPIGPEDDTPLSHSLASSTEKQRQEAEDLRRFYVAVTRHRDYVVFVAARQEVNKGKCFGKAHSNLRMLDDALDLGAALDAGGVTLPGGARVDVRLVQPPDRQHRRRQSLLDELIAGADSPGSLGESLAGAKGDRLPTAEFPHLGPVESRAVERLAPTALAEFEFCPMSFRWHHELRVPRAMLSQAAVNGDAAPEKPPTGDGEAALDPVVAGTLFHRCLELLDFASPRPPVLLVRQALAEMGLDIDPTALAGQLADMLGRFQKHPLWATLASAEQRLTELEFLTRIGDLELFGKIDLLARSAKDEWLIVDYKSDRVSPDRVAAHARRYELQMLAYSAAAGRYVGGKCEPGSAIPATLYFLRPGVAYEFPPERLSPASIDRRFGELVDQLRACRRDNHWPGREDEHCVTCRFAELCDASRDGDR